MVYDILKDTIASRFMEKESQSICRKLFSKVRITTFENPVIFSDLKNLMAYWRSHNLFNKEFEVEFEDASTSITNLSIPNAVLVFVLLKTDVWLCTLTTNSKLAAIYFPNLKFYLDKRNTACFPKRFEKPKGNSFL